MPTLNDLIQALTRMGLGKVGTVLFGLACLVVTNLVRLRWLFINISQDVKITVSPSVVYCPACGHLKISLAQAKQI